MDPVVVPLSAPEATDAARFGPKAANLAALGRAGMPTPGGYAVDARAYRVQLAELHLEATARGVFSADDHLSARRHALELDRKSTRLNSSHVSTSYAVFCLKKKKKKSIKLRLHKMKKDIKYK